MKKLIYMGMGLLLCLSATLWYGCKDKEELPGAIYGVVTDKDTGEPIFASVTLQGYYQEEWHDWIRTVSGNDGQYGFDDLKPGTYKLYVTKPGYEDLLSNEIVVQSGQTVRFDMQCEALR